MPVELGKGEDPDRPPNAPGSVVDGTRVIWINVVLGAVLMLATLPGRSQGLGLINAPLLRDLQLDEVFYATLNIWATLLGAAFCLPIGRLLDRCGLRWVSTALVVAFGLVIWRMSTFRGGTLELFFLLLFTRGLGQSALSVASLTTVGKSAGRKPGFAMGVFAVLMTIFMGIAFVSVQWAVRQGGWRFAWGWVAAALLLLVAPLVAGFVREPSGAMAPLAAGAVHSAETTVGFTLGEALRTRAFWSFCFAMALFSMASSGLGFWNTLVFAKQGYGAEMAGQFLAWMTGFGLLGQFGCGWLSRRYPLPRLFGLSMLIYGLGLLTLPFLGGTPALVFSSALFGISGGAVSVVFFAIWSAVFGHQHLGRIQGAAQISTVLASSVGPWLLAKSNATFQSYAPLLFVLTAVAIVSGIACWRVDLTALKRGE